MAFFETPRRRHHTLGADRRRWRHSGSAAKGAIPAAHSVRRAIGARPPTSARKRVRRMPRYLTGSGKARRQRIGSGRERPGRFEDFPTGAGTRRHAADGRSQFLVAPRKISSSTIPTFIAKCPSALFDLRLDDRITGLEDQAMPDRAPLAVGLDRAAPSRAASSWGSRTGGSDIAGMAK